MQLEAEVHDLEDEAEGFFLSADWDIEPDGIVDFEDTNLFDYFFDIAGLYSVTAEVADSDGGLATDFFDVGVYGMEDFPLDPPVAVEASDGTFVDRVEVTWEWFGEIEPESFFVIRQGGPEDVLVEIVPSGEGPYLSTDLEAPVDQKYSYAVLSFRSGYDTLVISADTGFVGIGTPRDVTATDGLHQDKVAVTWLAPDQGTEPTGYEIVRSANGVAGPYTFLATVTAPNTTYDDTDVSIGVTYHYKIAGTKLDYPDSAQGGPDQGHVGEE